MGQHMRFSYLSLRREAKTQLILRTCANSSEPCAVHTIIKLERTLSSLVFIHIRVHIYKMSSEKLRRQILIHVFIYGDRPVSREAQADLDRCLNRVMQ